MLATTTFILSLLSIPVSAGQHAGSNFRNNLNRRNHHRMVHRATPVASCDEGSWQCDGTELQRKPLIPLSCPLADIDRMRFRRMDDYPGLYRTRYGLLVGHHPLGFHDEEIRTDR